MSSVAMKGAEIMTDKQFDSIIEMVFQILVRATDLQDAKNALEAIKRGGIEDSKNS
jgi:hypothetical protein